jgi:hypothetical protein
MCGASSSAALAALIATTSGSMLPSADSTCTHTCTTTDRQQDDKQNPTACHGAACSLWLIGSSSFACCFCEANMLLHHQQLLLWLE